MGNKLFVGGISWDTDERGLRAACEPFGEVTDVRIITDRETGRSRGFGFVTFATDEQASNAITELDGLLLDGRSLRVNEANERGGGGGGGRGGGGDRGRDRY